ncbi:type II secretion system protein N [Castellaniella hirudinis]|uniref:type II secretion system protein N n=1 Tax=Castellaniella hirudinis TaxID=1144617 RepID=UPI0039C2E8D7
MKRLGWWCLLAGVALLAAALVLPARWLMVWTPDRALVRIADAQGSLWAGQARLAVGIPSQRRSLPDPVHWDVGLAGGPHLVLRHPWLRGPLTLSLGLDGVFLSAQSLRAPAFMLTTFHALFNALEPGGELLLQWPELRLGWRGGVTARQAEAPVLQAQWLSARSALSAIRPLGDYRASLSAAPSGAYALRLDTDRGPLYLQGEGVLPPAGRFQFQGWAWADPGVSDYTQQALNGLLTALGPVAGPEGRRSLRMH